MKFRKLLKKLFGPMLGAGGGYSLNNGMSCYKIASGVKRLAEMIAPPEIEMPTNEGWTGGAEVVVVIERKITPAEMMGRLYEYTSLSRKHGVIGVDKVFDKIHDVMADVSPKLMYTADIEEIASPELYHAIAQLGNYIQNYGHLYIALGAVLIAGGLLYLFREDLSRGIRSLVSRFKR